MRDFTITIDEYAQHVANLQRQGQLTKKMIVVIAESIGWLNSVDSRIVQAFLTGASSFYIDCQKNAVAEKIPAQAILYLLLPKDFIEVIVGDLMEMYAEDYAARGRFIAAIRYYRSFISLVYPAVILLLKKAVSSF